MVHPSSPLGPFDAFQGLLPPMFPDWPGCPLTFFPFSPAIGVLYLVDTLWLPWTRASSVFQGSHLAFPCGTHSVAKAGCLLAPSGSTFPDSFPWYGVLDAIGISLFASGLFIRT